MPKCTICYENRKIMVHDYCDQCQSGDRERSPICLDCYITMTQGSKMCPLCRNLLSNDVNNQFYKVSRRIEHFYQARVIQPLLSSITTSQRFLTRLMDIGSRFMGQGIRGNCGAIRDNLNNCINVLNTSRVRYLHIYETDRFDPEALLDAMFQTEMIEAETVSPLNNPTRHPSPGTAVDFTDVDPEDDEIEEHDLTLQPPTVRRRLNAEPPFVSVYFKDNNEINRVSVPVEHNTIFIRPRMYTTGTDLEFFTNQFMIGYFRADDNQYYDPSIGILLTYHDLVHFVETCSGHTFAFLMCTEVCRQVTEILRYGVHGVFHCRNIIGAQLYLQPDEAVEGGSNICIDVYHTSLELRNCVKVYRAYKAIGGHHFTRNVTQQMLNHQYTFNVGARDIFHGGHGLPVFKFPENAWVYHDAQDWDSGLTTHIPQYPMHTRSDYMQ
jgi:hypothetical protein